MNNLWNLLFKRGSSMVFRGSIAVTRDPKFISSFWSEVIRLFFIEHRVATRNHPVAKEPTELILDTLMQRLYSAGFIEGP